MWHQPVQNQGHSSIVHNKCVKAGQTKPTGCKTNDFNVIQTSEDVAPVKKACSFVMHKTLQGHYIVIFKGCIYRLDGKSVAKQSYRWKCIRFKDLQCTARIYSKHLADDKHCLYQNRLQENLHNHQALSDEKIKSFLLKNAIISDGGEKTTTKKKKAYTKIAPSKIFKGDAQSISINVHALSKPKKLKQEKSEAFANSHCYEADPRILLKAPQFGEKTKFSFLNSANGNRILIIEFMMFHLDKKGTYNNRIYWTCASRRKIYKCNCRVTTEFSGHKTKIVNITTLHNHPNHWESIKGKIEQHQFDTDCSESDEGRGESDAEEQNSKLLSKIAVFIEKSQQSIVDSNKTNNMKLYAVSDGPPSLAVRMCLKALNISHELHNVDYIASEHLSEEYAKLNPQKEIPVLDDNGFYLSESIAIMQYLCDKYAPDSNLYPQEANERAVVNHRLCFNTAFYYSAIGAYTMAPIFFDYKRTEKGLKKVNNALQVFETYLERAGTKYAAAEHLTIADFALISATICLEAIAFDLTPYPLICRWYNMFKKNYPELWKIADTGMQEIIEFEQNPPDLSHMNHPFHPVRK